MSTTVATVAWTGASGGQYTYYVYPYGTDLSAVAGNYCFAKRLPGGGWQALYFGETGDLSKRFENHHKEACAVRNGATHIHAHINNGGKDARLREEADLVRRYNPVCNG